MNMKKVVYPGNPIATVQLLGSEELPTTLKGNWKDRFVTASGSLNGALFNLSPNDQNVGLGNAKRIIEFFTTLRLQGQAISISWGDLYEEGFLKECHPNWLRPQEVEYTLEFEWYKQDIQNTKVAAPSPTTFQSIVNDISNIQSQISNFSDELFAIQGYLATITISLETAINGITGSIAYAVQNLITLGSQVLSMASIPINSYVSAVSLLNGILNSSANLIQALNNIETEVEQPTGYQQTQDYLNFITAMSNLKNQATLMINKSSTYSDQINSNYINNTDLITQYIAKDGDNLRMVSQKFYGDSSWWSYLADINFLQNSQLIAGTVVLVPKIPGSTIIAYPPPLNSSITPATVSV